MRLGSQPDCNKHHLRLRRVGVLPLVITCLLTCCLMIVSQAVNAQEIMTQRIISALSAQTMKDGQIEFSLDIDNWGEHAHLDYQVTPWLNMGVAYSHFELGSAIPVKQRYPAAYSYHFNAQLVQETDVWPAIAVGMEDFTDNADLKAQFIVASKEFNQWRVDMGIAKSANALDGLFGGVHYTLPDYLVRLSAQYIDNVQAYGDIVDEYALTSNRLSVVPSRHPSWSLQAQWQFTPGVALRLTHSQDSTIGLGLTVALDTKRPPARFKSPTAQTTRHTSSNAMITHLQTPSEQVPPALAPLTSVKNTGSFETQIKDALAALNIHTHSVVVNQLDNTGMQIVISQTAYPYWPDAIQQAHQQLLSLLPKHITHVQYVVKVDGHLVYRIRQDVIRDANVAKFVADMTPRAITSSTLADASSQWLSSMPDVDVKLAHQGWLSPQNSLRENTHEKMSQLIQAHVDVNWEFAPQWSIKQQTQFDLAERWSFSEQDAIDTPLPATVKRLVDKDVHISQLMLRYGDSHVTTEYDAHTQYDYQLYAGLLDNAWSGVGANVLYQPWQSRLSAGLSVAVLSARENYHAPDAINEMTQHGTMALASVYWASPFYDLDMALHAGRFVHQDTGTKIQIRRSLDNGWQFGIWASKTSRNGHAERHQGLSLSIPLGNVFNQYVEQSGQHHSSLHQYVGGNTSFTSRINQLDNTHAVMLESDASARWWRLRAARYSVFSDLNSTRMVDLDNVSNEATRLDAMSQGEMNLDGMSLDEASQNWLLTVGQYQVRGQVSDVVDTDKLTSSTVAPTHKHAQYVFRSVQGDELVFDASGLVKITTLAKRSLALAFNEVKGMRQVTLGDLNYAVYACSPLIKAGYSATQTCQSQPEHRIQIQYNNEFQPVGIAQWLPYLNQHLQLQRLN